MLTIVTGQPCALAPSWLGELKMRSRFVFELWRGDLLRDNRSVEVSGTSTLASWPGWSAGNYGRPRRTQARLTLHNLSKPCHTFYSAAPADCLASAEDTNDTKLLFDALRRVSPTSATA